MIKVKQYSLLMNRLLPGYIALVLIVFILMFSFCEQNFPDDEIDSRIDVSFKMTHEDGGLKSGENCAWEVDYALVIISSGRRYNRSNETYYLPTNIENGILYTESLELPVLEGREFYRVEEMILYADDNTTLSNPIDDRLISAAPHDNSRFGRYATEPISVDFEVDAFNTTEVGLSVFCFDGNPEDFGFVWFQPSITVLQQKWFFGDFCTPSFHEYAGSLYDEFGTLHADMPAIFQIKLFSDNNFDGIFYEDELVSVYGNEEQLSSEEPGPVSVLFSDDSSIENHFEIRIFVYTKVENGFAYEEFGSLYFENSSETLYYTPISSRDPYSDDEVEAGPDNIYEFNIGSCNTGPVDFQFGI